MDRQYDNNVVNTADVIISAYEEGHKLGRKKAINCVLTTTSLLVVGGVLLGVLYSEFTKKKQGNSGSTETESE